MTDPRDLRSDLEAGDAPDAEALLGVGRRLHAERPVPAVGFRSALRKHILSARSRAGVSERPAALGRLVAGYGLSGAALLAVAALGVAGAGPFAA